MCGRLNIAAPGPKLVEAFDIVRDIELFDALAPRYNVAPSQRIPAIRLDSGQRAACLLRWGLVPSWAKDEKIGYKMINARAETVAEKPAYRAAFKRHRCLIPATGFYEWQQSDGKQPYNIRRKDAAPFALAGLWEHWEREGMVIESCTIVVTEANDLMRRIHERMPVILHPKDYDLWLNPEVGDPERLLPLLIPYADEDLEMYPVSKMVNSPKNDRVELIEEMVEGGRV
ncbi:MAG: SOS response-associated peptidase [Gammaproteobacteria bacterium]|nr:SOS response-associated peptidase [Gammaproteobacteria bacterium]